MKNSISTAISVCSLIISITAGILIYQQQQHLEMLQQQLYETRKSASAHTKAISELQELLSRVTEESALDSQLNKMFESTKDKLQKNGQELFDSAIDSWEKLYPPTQDK